MALATPDACACAMVAQANMTGQNEAQKKFGDRCFMNLLEQAPMFLTSLWLFAINCSATEATALGTVYLVLRALYPVMWLIKGGKNVGYPMPVGFFVTFPAYAVIITMYISVIAMLGFDTEIPGGIGAKAGMVLGLTILYLVYAIKVCPFLQMNVFKGAFEGEPLL